MNDASLRRYHLFADHFCESRDVLTLPTYSVEQDRKIDYQMTARTLRLINIVRSLNEA